MASDQAVADAQARVAALKEQLVGVEIEARVGGHEAHNDLVLAQLADEEDRVRQAIQAHAAVVVEPVLAPTPPAPEPLATVPTPEPVATVPEVVEPASSYAPVEPSTVVESPPVEPAAEPPAVPAQ